MTRPEKVVIEPRASRSEDGHFTARTSVWFVRKVVLRYRVFSTTANVTVTAEQLTIQMSHKIGIR